MDFRSRFGSLFFVLHCGIFLLLGLRKLAMPAAVFGIGLLMRVQPLIVVSLCHNVFPSVSMMSYRNFQPTQSDSDMFTALFSVCFCFGASSAQFA